MELGWTIVLIGSLCLSGVIQIEAVTTTTPVTCAYTEMPMMQNAGATQMGTPPVDPMVCETTCTSNTQCTAYETTTSGQCWIYTNAIDPNAYRAAPDNTFFLKTTCTTGPPGGASVTTAATTTAATTTTTATTTVSGCTDTFTSNVGMNRQGGMLDGTLNTDAACRASCLGMSITDCAAYDFGGTSCYRHTSSNLVTFPALGQLSGNTHYVRVSCTVGVTTGCTDTFISTASTSVAGGTPQTSPPYTQQTCQAACVAVPIATCASIDFNQNGQCFFHTPATEMTGTRRSDAQVTHDVRVGCDGTTQTVLPTGSTACVDTFTVMNNQNYIGGTPISSANTQADCERECLAQTTCTGYDYSPSSQSGQRCFWFNNSNFTPGSATNVNHYRRIQCDNFTSTACVDTFTEMPNMQLFEGVPLGVRTTAECQAACLSELSCEYFETTGGRCYRHFSNSTASRDPVQLPVNSGHILYQRVSCTSSSTLSGTCRDSFTENVNTFYFGATQNPANTVAACTDACLAQTELCPGFDYTSSNVCWLHTVVSLADNANANTGNGVSHWRRNFDCNGTTISPVCRDTFLITVDRNRADGTIQNGINTQPACEGACLATSQTDPNPCYGYDFNFRDNSCYLHLNQISSTTNPFQGVNTYERQFICQLSSTGGDVCTDTFQAFPNSNVFGGVGVASATTEELCRSTCLAAPEGNTFCYGYDFDGTCFVHRSVDLADPSPAPGVTHYRRNRICASISPTGSNCVEQYNQTANRNAPNGQAQGAQTVEQCINTCNARNMTCYGFDHDGTNCWIQETENYVLNTNTFPGVTNYRRLFNCQGGSTTGGTCRETFSLRQNTQLFGGAETASGTTIELCADACRLLDTCLGYNWDKVATSGIRCYLLADLERTVTNNDIDLYVKDNTCSAQSTTPSTTQCVMTLAGAGNVPGGQRVTSATTLEQCQTYCIDNEPCMAVDWDKLVSACFWFSASTGDPSGDACCDHYIKSCTGTCVDTYNVTRNFGYPGGTEVRNRPTPTACAGACNEAATCEAYDFNTNANLCYVHTSATIQGTGVSGEGSDHYRRNRCPDSQRTTTVPPTMRTTLCPTQYTRFPGQNALGGIEQPSLNSQQACENACTPSSTCDAYDYDTNANACYFHTGQPALRNAPGVTHYRKRPCVTPAPTVAPTSIPLTCNSDLVFLMDTSTDIYTAQTRSDYLDLLSNIMTGLNVGDAANQVRVYGRIFGPAVSYDMFSAVPQFSRNSVNLINAARGGGIFGIFGSSSLQTAMTDYINQVLGSSAGRPIILVVASSFNTATLDQTTLNTLAARQPPITIVSVGSTGTENNPTQVANSIRRVYAGYPNGLPVSSASPLFLRPQNVLPSTAGSIRGRFPALCFTTVTPTVAPTLAPPPRICSGDVAVLFDDSGSIRAQPGAGTPGAPVDNWALLRGFVSDTIAGFNPSATGTRIALIKFSTGVEVLHRFSDAQNTQAIQNRLNGALYTGGETRLLAGLDTTWRQVFNQQGADRNTEPNVLIVVTDGIPTNTTDIMLRDYILNTFPQGNPIIIPVGVTNQIRQSTLEILANTNLRPGQPRTNPITVANFGLLSNIVGNLVSTSCNAVRR